MTIFIGDSLTWLKRLPSDSVHCVVTSPPYYGLRDYGIAGQIGLEETPEMFIEKLVNVFREVRRVLRPDGTCWVNMGDSYATSQKGSGGASTKQLSNAGSRYEMNQRLITGLADKQLMMIPARLAIALQADGWWLRSQIVWAKPNPMPESVTDRPTKSHEFIYLLTKNANYWYDADAVREQGSENSHGGGLVGEHRKDTKLGRFQTGLMEAKVTGTRNKRDVWTIPTQSFAEAHFATFPQELAETCIKAGCPETVCAVCGAGYVRITEKSYNMGSEGRVKGLDASNGWNGFPRATVSVNTLGFNPSCACNGTTCNGMVLDPFGGAGTTALAAIHLNRQYQLIELSIKYAGIAQKRIANYNPMQHSIFADGSKQLSLWAKIEVSA